MTTGRVRPRISLERSLNWETNWPMFTPCWPRAGPTGGAGGALPPVHFHLARAVTAPALALQARHDLAFHVLEGAVQHPDAVAAAELRLGRDALFLLLARLGAHHPLDLAVRHGRRRAVDGAAHEVAHPGRLAEQVEDAVVVLDLGHEVAGVELGLLGHPLPFPHLAVRLGRDEDLPDEGLHAPDLAPPLDGLLDGLLAAALDLDDV